MFVAYAALCALAWVVTHRQRAHLGCATYLTFMAGGELVRPVLSHVYRGTPKPYAGWARLAFHADYAITLGWQLFFLACCVHYFTRKSPALVFALWGGTWCAFVIGHGRMSPGLIASVYFAVWAVSIVGGWACIAWGLFRGAHMAPNLAHLVLILFAASDVGTILLRLVVGLRENWDIARIAGYFVTIAGIVAHAGWLMFDRRRVRAA